MAEADTQKTLTEHHFRLSRLEDYREREEKARQMQHEEEARLRDVMTDLRLKVAQLSTRLEITWGFMAAIILSLIGVAFSLWTK